MFAISICREQTGRPPPGRCTWHLLRPRLSLPPPGRSGDATRRCRSRLLGHPRRRAETRLPRCRRREIGIPILGWPRVGCGATRFPRKGFAHVGIADELSHHSLVRVAGLHLDGAAPTWSCACQGWTCTVSFNAAIVLHATHQAAALSAAHCHHKRAARSLPHGTILVDPADDSGYLVDGVGWEYVARRLEGHRVHWSSSGTPTSTRRTDREGLSQRRNSRTRLQPGNAKASPSPPWRSVWAAVSAPSPAGADDSALPRPSRRRIWTGDELATPRL